MFRFVRFCTDLFDICPRTEVVRFCSDLNKTEHMICYISEQIRSYPNISERGFVQIFSARPNKKMFGFVRFLPKLLKNLTGGPNKSKHFFCSGELNKSEQIWTKPRSDYMFRCLDMFGFVRICSVLFRSEQNRTTSVRGQMPNKSELVRICL